MIESNYCDIIEAAAGRQCCCLAAIHEKILSSMDDMAEEIMDHTLLK